MILVLHISYSAYLVTKLTARKYTLPFEDLQGLYNKKKDYTLGIMKDSTVESALKVIMDD